jgi:hypothetical protein
MSIGIQNANTKTPAAEIAVSGINTGPLVPAGIGDFFRTGLVESFGVLPGETNIQINAAFIQIFGFPNAWSAPSVGNVLGGQISLTARNAPNGGGSQKGTAAIRIPTLGEWIKIDQTFSLDHTPGGLTYLSLNQLSTFIQFINIIPAYLDIPVTLVAALDVSFCGDWQP